jgi:hypothetical protein
MTLSTTISQALGSLPDRDFAFLWFHFCGLGVLHPCDRKASFWRAHQGWLGPEATSEARCDARPVEFFNHQHSQTETCAALVEGQVIHSQ